jgi:spore germination cell wall hydrolase CwlJ-like protein
LENSERFFYQNKKETTKMNKILFVATMYVALFVNTAIAEPCDEIETLALNIYHEARGEGLDGMQMVGEVTLNRVYHDSYPNNVCDVVYQRSQFSWTRTKKDYTPYEKDLWELSLEIAEGLLNGEIDYFDNGATHFINPKKVSKMPRWTREYDAVGQIGNHKFYARNQS